MAVQEPTCKFSWETMQIVQSAGKPTAFLPAESEPMFFFFFFVFPFSAVAASTIKNSSHQDRIWPQGCCHTIT